MSKTESLTNNVKAFFALLRAGLWETDVRLSPFGKIDYSEVYRLAEEQSVVGLVAAGLNHVIDTKVPRQDLLKFIGATLQMEERNKAMNYFIGVIVNKMRTACIYTLLVKGQGVALCYERPLWRSSGDVDFYLSKESFTRAKTFFRPLAESLDPDNDYSSHINMSLDSWVVEIHANQHCGLSSRIDKVLDTIHSDLFNWGNIRSCIIGDTQVFLPSPDNDIIIVFTHFLNHFYRGGLGVRQICDWSRLLWTYRDSINQKLLNKRLRSMGLLTEWKAFGSFAVEYLGMPEDAMPFYEKTKSFKRKAGRIKDFVMEVGNFGHNRNNSYYGNHSLIVRKAISFGRRLKDLVHHSAIFPLDSVRFLIGITCKGLRSFAHGE